MRRSDVAALAVAISLVLATQRGFAQPDAGPKSAGAGSAAGAPSASAGLPAGHPPVDDSNPHGAMPAGMFQAPEDVEEQDASLAPGTIAVDVRDADDKPIGGETVNLGILINSIAKGDTRKHEQSTTDAAGRAVFSGFEPSANTAYRISVGHEGGLFGAMPFQLQQAKSMHVVLHVYPVTRKLKEFERSASTCPDCAVVLFGFTLAAEVRDDRIQVEEALTVYNVGRFAWQPDDVRLSLPEGFTGFGAQASMSDQGVDETGGSAKLRGTFAPGQSTVEFRWQVPWSGESDVDFDVGLPPHVMSSRVMMPATADVKLAATGLPPPEVRRDTQGQSFLVTERRLRPDEPKMTSMTIGIHGLPSAGSGRIWVSLLAGFGVLVGLAFAVAGRTRGRARSATDERAARAALLAELEDLERAVLRGDVGPKTYERARRELIDAIARALEPMRPGEAGRRPEGHETHGA